MLPELSEALREQCATLEVRLSDAHLERFGRYLDLLVSWNRKINLTAVRSSAGILSKHFVDSLAAAPFLQSAGTLVDVGSGAGFPGIPLAIVLPGLRVTLIESTAKKGAFLRQAVHLLGLGARVVDARLEDWVKLPFEPFDAAVSRATFPPEEWLERAPGLVHDQGKILLMTGREEPLQTHDRLRFERTVSYRLASGEQRHLGIYVPRGTPETSTSDVPRGTPGASASD